MNPYPSINVGSIPANDGAARGALAIGAGLSDLGRAAGGIANNLQQTQAAMAKEQARREGAAREAAYMLELTKSHIDAAAQIDALDAVTASERAKLLPSVQESIGKTIEGLPRKYAQDKTELDKFTNTAYTTYQSGLLKLAKHRLTLPSAQAEESLNGTMELQTRAGVSPSTLVGATFRGGQLVAESAFGGADSEVGRSALANYNKRVTDYTGDHVSSRVNTAKLSPKLNDIFAAQNYLNDELRNLKSARDSGALMTDDTINKVQEGLLSLEVELRKRVSEGATQAAPPLGGITGDAPLDKEDVYNAEGRALIFSDNFNHENVQALLEKHGYKSDKASVQAYMNAGMAEKQRVTSELNSNKSAAISAVVNKYGDMFDTVRSYTRATVDAAALMRTVSTEQEFESARLAVRAQTQALAQKDAATASAYYTGSLVSLAQNDNPKLAVKAVLDLASHENLRVDGFQPGDFRSEPYKALRAEIRGMFTDSPGVVAFLRRYPEVGLDILTTHLMANTTAREAFFDKEGTSAERYAKQKSVFMGVLNASSVTNAYYAGVGEDALYSNDLSGILSANSKDNFSPNLFGAVRLSPGSDNSTRSSAVFVSASDRFFAATNTAAFSDGHLAHKLYASGDLKNIAKKLVGQFSDDEMMYAKLAAYIGMTESAIKESGERWALTAMFNKAVADKTINFGPAENMPDYTQLELAGVSGGGRYMTADKTPLYVSTQDMRQYNELTAFSGEYARRNAPVLSALRGGLTKGPDAAIAVAASHPRGLRLVSDTVIGDAESILSTPLEEIRESTYRTGYGSTSNTVTTRVNNQSRINVKKQAWVDDTSRALSHIARKVSAVDGTTLFVPYPGKKLTSLQEGLINEANILSARLTAHQQGVDVSKLPGVPRKTPTPVIEAPSVKDKKEAPRPVSAIYYTDGNREHPSTVISNTLSRVKKQLDITMYTLNDEEHIDSIIAAAQRGVKTRVILDPEQDPGGAVGAQLVAGGVQVRYGVAKGPTGATHIKEAIADDEILGGSYNWTVNARNNSREDLRYQSDPDQAKESRSVFEKRWKESNQEHTSRKKPSKKK